MRAFVEAELSPHCGAWDAAKALPREVFRKAARAGLLPAVVGAPWPAEAPAAGPEGFDAFHELIALDEACRCGSGGVIWGLLEGLMIGLPPVLHFGSQHLKDKCARACLAGEKIICLCITEPYAGSDVANLRCTAEKSACGTHYVVNGEKKWITNGTFADFFTVAVRTGPPGSGSKGLSLLLLERGMPGITTKQMDCMGVWASGTAYVTFEDVKVSPPPLITAISAPFPLPRTRMRLTDANAVMNKVPVANLIGEENGGFKSIMYNFNHERWGFVVQANRFARVCLEEAVKYAQRRRTFGKKLMDHPVIRWKVAEMARHIEATHGALELLTYQMCQLSKDEQMRALGVDCALLKVQATKTFEYCAREAAQIFGGNSYTRGGQGEKVERLYREVRAYAIPGGSEEILMDYAVRQAVKEAAQAKL